MRERIPHLDVLRILGILLIMIAHAAPPGWLFQLRNFDVPLLIVVSAITYSNIYKNKELEVKSFYLKRLKRLILPSWVFLLFFFIFIFILVQIGFLDFYPFNFDKIIETFTFYKGIGFVWIFKVFIILALVTPLGLKLKSKVTSNTKYFLILILIYVIYEFLVKITSIELHGSMLEFTNNLVLIILPYSVLYFYGLRLSYISNKSIILVCFISLSVFSILAISKYIVHDELIPTQNYKYPPTIYYLSYAFFALNMAYLISKVIPFPGKLGQKIILWLSSNSLWIYLWHILAWYLWSFVFGFERGSFMFFAVKCAWLISFGIIFTYLQISFLKRNVNKETLFGRRILEILT